MLESRTSAESTLTIALQMYRLPSGNLPLSRPDNLLSRTAQA
jgi:hypothetical protein